MKILTDYTELIGKTNAFVHAEKYSENITIATTDRCVLVMTRKLEEYEVDTYEICVLSEPQALAYIERNAVLREKLANL